jgi:uncharacterized protein (DUF983 family)
MSRFFAHVWAILLLRCPRCLQGRVYSGLMRMNDHCSVCRIRFEKEPGYFLGAMYASYFLGVGFLTAFYVAARSLFPDWPSALVAAAAVVPYIPLVPVVWRYSRVIWMHIDIWGPADEIDFKP